MGSTVSFSASVRDFRGAAADVLLLCVFRLLALALLSAQAASLGAAPQAGFAPLDVEAGTEAKEERRKLVLRVFSFALCAVSQVVLGAKAVALPPLSGGEDWGTALRLLLLVAFVHTERSFAEFAAAKLATPQAKKQAAAAASAVAAASAGPGKVSRAAGPTALYTDAGPAPKSEEELSSTRYLRWCLGFARTQASFIGVGMLCMLVGTSLDLCIPRLTGAALNDALAGNRASFMARIRHIIALQAAAGALGGLRGLLLSTTNARLLRDLSVSLFAALLRQDVTFFDATSSGDLLSRLNDDAKASIDPASWLLQALTRNMVQALGSAVLCFSISWRLSLLAGSALGPVYALSAAYASYSAKLQKDRADAMGAASSTAGDALGNIRLVRACSSEDVERRKYRERVDFAAQLGIKDARAFAATITLNEWVTLVSTCVLLACGGDMIIAKTLSLGAFISFQQYYGRIDASFTAVVQFLQTLTAAAGSAERVLSVLELKPLVGSRGGFEEEDGEEDDGPAEPKEGAQLPPGPLPVSLTEVCFTYALRRETPVLCNLSLELAGGKVAALVGTSGAGKSTVIALLLRFYDPQSGSVRVGGVDLRTVSPRVLHDRVGLVAQDSPVFAASLMDNITYGLRSPPAEQTVRDAAAAAGALGFIEATATGFDTIVGERGVRLSGGQRQRIALTRAMLRRPSLMLLDEATSALDAESEAVVQAGLDAAIKLGEQTVVIVAHRLSTIRGADSIAVLKGGALAEQGGHAELLVRGGIYASLVSRQVGVTQAAE